jgi:hypothetical protein
MVTMVMKDTKVITGRRRFAFVNLFTPRVIGQSQVLKYSLCLLIPKDDRETVMMIEAAVDEAINQGKAIWGGDVS